MSIWFSLFCGAARLMALLARPKTLGQTMSQAVDVAAGLAVSWFWLFSGSGCFLALVVFWLWLCLARSLATNLAHCPRFATSVRQADIEHHTPTLEPQSLGSVNHFARLCRRGFGFGFRFGFKFGFVCVCVCLLESIQLSSAR